MKAKPKITPAHQSLFMKMLPVIQRTASINFRDLNAEAKAEATAEVIAHAFVMFVGLVGRGRQALAYPSVLAMYGIKRVKIGRKAASPQSVTNVSSRYCRIQKGVKLETLDHFDCTEGIWREAVIPDDRRSPSDQAAFRIDFPAYLDTLSPRDRKIALELAAGERPGVVAKQLGISAGRISQIRSALAVRWREYHGEEISEVRQAAA